MTNLETRAQDFINKATQLELSDADLHIVLDDLLDVDNYHEGEGIGRSDMQVLHEFGLTMITSDDDYDDFRREVSGLLAGDDACQDCHLDPDDCECDDEELEADPIDLQDEAEGRF